MRNSAFLWLIAAAWLLSAPAETAGQRRLNTRFQGWVLTGWGGGAAFTDLQRAPLEVGERSGSRVQRLMVDASPSVGVALGYWAKPSWGVRVQSGVALTRYSLLVPGEPNHAMVDSGGPNLWIWSHDANLLVRAPVTPGGRIVPYGIAGGGVLFYKAAEDQRAGPFEFARTTYRPAFLLGLGAMVPLEQGGTALSFELLDHIARTPVEAPGGGEPATGHVRWANHLRLTVGISVLLGG